MEAVCLAKTPHLDLVEAAEEVVVETNDELEHLARESFELVEGLTEHEEHEEQPKHPMHMRHLNSLLHPWPQQSAW